MSQLRAILLQLLYDGPAVRAPYVDVVRSLIERECVAASCYEFFDSERRREGIVYPIGHCEVFWLWPTAVHPQQLLVPDARLRENLLDLLAVHPLYAKWFGH